MLCLTLAGCGGESTAASPAPEEDRTVYGIWWSYQEYEKYCTDLDEETYRTVIQNACDNLKDLGINTVYIHAVSYTDAFYRSDIYPFTTHLGSCDYDPLAVWVKLAHANDLKIEAWVNPMRSILVSETDSLPDDFIVKQWIRENNERIRQVNDRYYLNPAYQECRDLITSVVKEIARNYDVDGIHMDDYFYPEGTEDNFDAYVFSKAQEENEELDRSTFRINNVRELVKEIHDTVKSAKSDLRYGISPAGNMENNLLFYYADPSQWVKDGTVDYLEPQIYWGFEHPVKPYESTLEAWMEITEGTDVQMLPGLAAYKINTADAGTTEWQDNDDILARQTQMAMEKGCDGVVYFDYEALFDPAEENKEIVENEFLHIKNCIQDLQQNHS